MNIIQYLFENSAELDKEFVLGNKETIAFKDLYRQSSQMANYISENFRSQNNIALVSSNNCFFLTCYLGIMLSGNVCVPINPNIEEENLEYILKKCECQFGFFEKRSTPKIDLHFMKIVTENQYLDIIDNRPIYKSSNSFNSNLPAQIIFTSGSTGKPKGVVLSHKNLIANTGSIIEYLHLSKDDTMEVVLPFFYCYGLSLLHTHLRVGGSIVLNNFFMFTGTVLKDINKYKCTGFAGVPSHFQILLRKSKSFKNTTFPSLRYVTQAGGKLHNSYIKEFMSAFPNIRFYVMYGQTEATARLSYLEPQNIKNKLGSIGKGIPNVKLKVVNKRGEQVKPGETGEVIASGDNIMLGYYKDNESTGKQIRDGWLYTGDIGTVDKDGYIYLSARKKNIIKIAGKRISPMEIEEVIVSHPDVIDCTVEAIDDEVTGEAIKAIVVLKSSINNEITESMLKSWCSGKLVQYKVPKIIKFSKELKINSAGKKVKGNV